VVASAVFRRVRNTALVLLIFLSIVDDDNTAQVGASDLRGGWPWPLEIGLEMVFEIAVPTKAPGVDVDVVWLRLIRSQMAPDLDHAPVHGF